jgi:2-methylcitrate dehydratase PrpD
VNLLNELATFVATASARNLPALDREILRRHAADVVVARIAGAHTSEGRAVAALFPGGRGAGSIGGLCALVRLTEIDDIHIGSCTTPSSVGVPVALGIAAEGGCDPEQMESAIWAGTELIVRIGKAIDGARVLYKGLWPTRTGATLGAAAAAARAWCLTTQQTAHALSLAAMTTTGRTGKFQGEPSGRWIVFEAAVSDGIKAAAAARAGFSGDLNLLDGKWLEGALGVAVDTAHLTHDLGTTSIYPEMSLKPYCTARQALSATEAMRELMAEGLDPNSITRIVIRVPTAYAGMVSQKLDPAIRASSYVSAAGQVAVAALAPEALYDVERASVLGAERILRLSQLATVEADTAFDATFPQVWPAELIVETSSGTLHCKVTDPVGAPSKRIDDAGLLTKSRKVLSHIGMSDAADAVMELSRSAFTQQHAADALARVLVTGSVAG